MGVARRVAIQDASQLASDGGGVPIPETVVIDDSTRKSGGVSLHPSCRAIRVIAQMLS